MNQEMEPLWKMQEYVEFEDIVAWRDEVGVRKGVVYENGSPFQRVAGAPT